MFNDGELRRILDHLPHVKAPDAIWASIEAALEERSGSEALGCSSVAMGVRRSRSVGLARRRLLERRTSLRTRRDLVRVDGSPVEAGHWIETDSRLRVTVKVGEIGSVEVEPGTRLRVVTRWSG